jgi:hypothetical protein
MMSWFGVESELGDPGRMLGLTFGGNNAIQSMMCSSDQSSLR